jgi:hypothetical protein
VTEAVIHQGENRMRDEFKVAFGLDLSDTDAI